MNQEIVNVRLVHENKVSANQSANRFYEFDKPITKYPISDRNWDVCNHGEYLKDEYKKFTPKVPNLVVVSDSRNHFERLVFLGFKYGNEYGYLSKLHIDGALTFLIHGGDERSMKPDEVYLRRIASCNGYKLNLIK